jgi:hypothetical protein
MNEEFLHYIWSQELFEKVMLADTGEKIEILAPGVYNKDAGPDFMNARIKIDATIWAGNIEIHLDSEAWKIHRHAINLAYNNVILHVVLKSGEAVFRQNGTQIPTVVLKFDPKIFKKYLELSSGKPPLPCSSELKRVDDFIINMWLESLMIERLESKTAYIRSLLEFTKESWEDTFYIILARNFGFNTNALPFELLAKSIPLKILSKYRNNLIQLEALLFGQAGFLNNEFSDEYALTLKKEYEYIRKAHNLVPIENHLWKFLRLRPINFPAIRIAQFAALVHKSNHLFSKTIEANTIDDLELLYKVGVSDYWKNHFTFNKTSKSTSKIMGELALTAIIINTVIPFMFIYGILRAKSDLKQKALYILGQIPAEKNHITRSWVKAGIVPDNASQSQALIQLSNEYCKQKNCIYCQIGNSILRNRN